jgi:hypothetical protein
MKRLLVTALLIVAAAMPLLALAAGFSHTSSLEPGSVTVTNAQANSSWVPVSVLIRYAEPSSGSAEIWRISEDFSFELGSCTFSNVTTIVWIPSVAYSFAEGDALKVVSSETNGVVQIMRRGD